MLGGGLQVACVQLQGFCFTCLLSATGTVRCFGDNRFGQAGIGATSTTPANSPGSVVISNVAVLSAGYHHVCALTTGNGVRCWGNNDYGQLGVGTTTQAVSPPATDTITGVAQLAAGSFHTCVLLLLTGGLRCFGFNFVSSANCYFGGC